MKERRYDIDWLRVIAILVVFIYHCTRFFGTEDWHLKVPAIEQSDTVNLLREFLIEAWFMPCFFLLAGFASQYSLRRRSGGQYLLERVKRLLIPLYTVGLFILVVPQAYFDGVTSGRITGTFWQWFPNYFRSIPGDITSVQFLNPISLVPYTFSGHLWFLQLLFVVSLVTLPLLLYLKSERGQRLIERLAGWCARPGGIFLFVIPLAIAQVGLRWLPVTTDRTWADFFWFAIFFVAGYLIAADSRFTDSIKKHGWVSLALWIMVFWGAGGLFVVGLGYDPSPGHGFSLVYMLWEIAWSIISWSAVVFMLSLGAKALNFSNKTLAYSNEAVLPFFLFHQTIILIVGWFVLPWDMGNLLKFLVIAVVSFALTMALYEVFVRRFNVVRFFFGMPPKKKPSAKPLLSNSRRMRDHLGRTKMTTNASQKAVGTEEQYSLVKILVIIAVLAALLVACNGNKEVPITVPEGAQAGDLFLEPCVYTVEADNAEYAADCGILVVPENRKTPDSRLIALPVTRVHATGDNPVEPIFWIEGGPGHPNALSYSADGLFENHDFVMVGYRGAEGQVILECPELSEAIRKATGGPLDDASLDDYSAGLARCAERLTSEGIDLAGYTITETIDDMETAREALGYDRINLYGNSYGTRLEMIYEWRYPASLNRVVMVAVNPPGHFVWDPDVTDGLVEEYSRLCAQDAVCSARTDNLAETMRQVSNNMPERWLFFPIDADAVKLITYLMFVESIQPSGAPVPLYGPAAIDMWLSAAEGDPNSKSAGFL